jgi:tetratricopeptide (TPR) repeat protein
MNAGVGKIYRRALDGYEKAWGPDYTSTLSTVNNLGNLYADQNKLGEAEKIYRRALDGYEKVWGPDHPFILRTINNLRLLNASRGGYMKVEEKHSRALDRSNGAHDDTRL